MNEFIKRQDAIDVVAKDYRYESDRISALRDVPAADVRENVHGEWLPYQFSNGYTNFTNYTCSVCGRKLVGYTLAEAPFCHCGADMRGRETK